ncbi:MAG: DUF6382 domain-containing protein [Eubacteriaceae bacterium]|nr:DUF6382 domain-containing protein [Eubacteriaceae bacterium]
MNLKEMNYKVEYERDMILPFEELMLTSGKGDFSIPMHFTSYGDRKIVKYDCDGYTALSEIVPAGIRSIFEIIEMTMIVLKKSQEYLLDTQKMVLSRDTVFIDVRNFDIRIAYVAGNVSLLNDKIACFIKSFAEDCDRQARGYLEKTADTAAERNLSLDGVINCIGEIKREMHICGVQ